MAVAFGIAKGFGLEKLVEKQILEIARQADWQADVTKQLLVFSRSMLEHVRGGLIAGLGVLVLFWTVVSILGKIEDSLNAVWDVKKTRPLSQKFTDYITMVVFAPILFAISSSATVLLATQVKAIMSKIAMFGIIGSIFLLILKVLPYVSMWSLLTLVYVVLPNTKVPIRSAIIGAAAAGTVFQIVQWLYVKFQIGITNYGAIYGSFAALPLFLVWLQMSWMIILFGAEIARATQNHETFGFHPDFSRISLSSKKVLILSIFHLIVDRFAKGEEPPDARKISDTLQIPQSLVRKLVDDLVEAGLVVRVAKGVKEEPAYQPARTIEGITLKSVLEYYEGRGVSFLPAYRNYETQRILERLRKIDELIERSPENVHLKDIQ